MCDFPITLASLISFKGAEPGGSYVDFHFLIFLIEENVSYQERFSEWKNIVPSQSYCTFKSQKSIFYKFWVRPLKLGNYVLGTKTKLLSEPIFNKASEVTIWIFEISKCPFLMNFCLPANFKTLDIFTSEASEVMF